MLLAYQPVPHVSALLVERLDCTGQPIFSHNLAHALVDVACETQPNLLLPEGCIPSRY